MRTAPSLAMDVFDRSTDVPHRSAHASGRCSVAIGNFDGIHLGHQALIRSTIAEASRLGARPAVLTFFPHPSRVLSPNRPFRYLSTAEEKEALLRDHGIEILWRVPFDRALASLSPLEFFSQFIQKGLNAQSVHVGEGFGFGKARAGDTGLLREYCGTSGIQLHVEHPLGWDGERISSTRIRSLLGEGNLEKANRLLGRPYSLSGEVVHGHKRGAQLGIPTANLHVDPEKQLPPNGVYVTRSWIGGQEFASVTNVGIRPTFEKKGSAVVAETHFLGGVKGDFYGQHLNLHFQSFLREERTFPSVDALRDQIQKDIEAANRWGK